MLGRRLSVAIPVHSRPYLSETLATLHDGAVGTVQHAVRVTDSQGDVLSPWHDVPLRVADSHLVNFVAEIPKGDRAKYEISTTDPGNPIKFDVTKDGSPRLYPFPSLVNYGALPQTWEDPSVTDPHLNLGGDNDPLDVCEIGSKPATIGAVYPVKVLGALALLDEGEVDWKIIAINAMDPKAALVNDIADVPAHFGSLLDTIIRWFRVYKVPDGKPENEFGFDSQPQDAAFAHQVIADTHEAWKGLVNNPPSSTRLYGVEAARPRGAHLWVPPPVALQE